MANQFLHMDVLVRLRSPPDCLRGKVTGVAAGESLTLSDVYSVGHNMWFPNVVVDAGNILELTNAVDEAAPTAAAAAAAVAPEAALAAPTATLVPAVFSDPAIVSLGPRSARSSDQGMVAAPALNKHALQTRVALQNRSLHASNANSSNDNSRSSSIRSTTRFADPAVAAEPLVAMQENVGPTASAADGRTYVTQPGAATKNQGRQKHQQNGKLNTNVVPEVANGRINWTPTAERAPAEPPKPPASVCIRVKGRHETSTSPGAAAVQQAITPKKAGGRRQQQSQKQRPNRSQRAAGYQQEGGWALEDVADVQGMGDFDFEGSLAKFDKRALFDQMRREDQSDDANRLVTHNRRPAPRPGTAGGKSLHYTENVLSMPSTIATATAAATAAANAAAAALLATATESETYFEDDLPKATVPPPAQPRPVTVATDFWNSDADDTAATAERLSPRDLGSRQSSRRGESKARRPQARKTSAAAHGQGPRQVHSVAPSARSAPAQSFCLVPSGRRIGSVSALQMLNLENIAHNEMGLTEDMMTENAGRGIAEVALTALSDPAIKIRNGTATEAAAAAAAASRNNKRNNRHRRSANGVAKAPAAPTVVILAGNSKSGMRAVASGRHLQNRGVNVLVCVVGIERGERALLEGFRQQIRLLQNLGGRIYSKSALFEHLRQATIATLTIEATPTRRTAETTVAPPPPAVTLIVDALLGLAETFDELRTGDQATVYELMEWANRNEAFVLAVDVPSGLDPSTGAISIIDGARLYVQPRYVVALGAPKRGLLEALAAAEASERTTDTAASAAAAAVAAATDGRSEAADTADTTDMADDDDTLPAAATEVEATVADDPARDWQLFVADIGLAAAVWRKGGMRLRQGVDFGDKWVLQMKYEGLAGDESSSSG